MQDKVKVLLVDDEDRFCKTTSRLLNRKGFDTAVAGNAEKALRILKEKKKDVIVLDIQMGGMDGHAALQEIKKTDPDIQVIILTGYGSRYSAMRALVREAFDYLAKPCDVEILASRIQDAYLAKHRKFKFDDKKALDIMVPLQKFTSISPDMRLEDALEIKTDLLAVINEKNTLVGVLTPTDVIKAVRPEYSTEDGSFDEESARFSCIFWSGFFSDRIKTIRQKNVRDILTDRPPEISENANLLEVAHLMSKSLKRVLLVKDISKVVGVIRERDIFDEIITAMKK